MAKNFLIGVISNFLSILIAVLIRATDMAAGYLR